MNPKLSWPGLSATPIVIVSLFTASESLDNNQEQRETSYQFASRRNTRARPSIRTFTCRFLPTLAGATFVKNKCEHSICHGYVI